MGVDLMGHGGASFTWDAWRSCFNIALAFGWEPGKTLAPENYEGEWKGGYFSNDYQEVTPEDAHALADALFMAVEHMKKRLPLTGEQEEALEGADFRSINELAEYALGGRFWIG